MKTCNKCKLEKELTEFHKKKTGIMGVHSICKVCCNAEKKEYYQKNKERLKEKQARYREENRGRINEHAREYSKNNREAINKKNKLRYNTDESFRLRSLVQKRINRALKNEVKLGKTQYLLDTDIETYKEYLELLFEDGMEWSNYGEWQIDHIIPVSYFDLTKEEEQKKAFCFTNTRPMWKSENLAKGDKIPYIAGLLLNN